MHVIRNENVMNEQENESLGTPADYVNCLFVTKTSQLC